MIDMKIIGVRVFLRDHGTDSIEILTDLPTPITSNPSGIKATFSCEVTRGAGQQWVREYIGVEPEIFDPHKRGSRPKD